MGASEQTRALDVQIAELAGRQHGVVARRQLAALGAGRRAIEVRLQGGRLHRLHPGIYAVGHRVLSREARWRAAVLFCGPEAVLSHRSAAALWGLRSPIESIEVTAPTKSRSRSDIRRHFAFLPADEVTEREGVPVTTVPRTIFDLAASEPLDRVERTLRESERKRLYDSLSLGDLLYRYPRHRGNRTIRECLRRLRDLPDGVTREELEARFLTFLDRHGFPRPRLNAWLTIGSHRYQVDCLWAAQKVIVELDGYETHGTRGAFEDDRDRDRRLLAAGYRGPRVTWRHLHEIPGEIASDLRTLLVLPSR
jgi:very-short-patch-repair endonuclease